MASTRVEVQPPPHRHTREGFTACGIALLPLALATHLVYGEIDGAALACLTRRSDLQAGLLWGGGLWAVAGLVWLPYLGWGAFGLQHTAAIAVVTLVLHLNYGAALGWLADRYRPAQ